MAEFLYYSILNHFLELGLLIFLFAIMLLDLKSLYTLLFCHWSIVFRLTSTLIWKSSQCLLTDDLDCSYTYPYRVWSLSTRKPEILNSVLQYELLV
jgi:hypothetical protein